MSKGSRITQDDYTSFLYDMYSFDSRRTISRNRLIIGLIYCPLMKSVTKGNLCIYANLNGNLFAKYYVWNFGRGWNVLI